LNWRCCAPRRLIYAQYLYKIWRSDSNLSGVNYLYYSNVANCLAFLPLYLITWLAISAGNLTASSNGQHFLPPWFINSLLALGGALFVTLLVPAMISAKVYTHWVKEAKTMMEESLASAENYDTAGSSIESKQALIQQLIDQTYAVLNPLRRRAYYYQIRYRYVEITVFGVLILVRLVSFLCPFFLLRLTMFPQINLCGFVFLIRHIRQDKGGRLVLGGTAVVAPLETHLHPYSSSPSPSSPSADENAKDTASQYPVGAVGFGRSLTRTATVGGREVEDDREAYEREGTTKDETTRAPWDVTLVRLPLFPLRFVLFWRVLVLQNYFCVVPICILVIGFISWVVHSYGSIAINSALTFVSLFFSSLPSLPLKPLPSNRIELAATSVVWAHTLVSITTTSALVAKKLFSRPSSSLTAPPRFADNPFNTRTGRRGVEPTTHHEQQYEPQYPHEQGYEKGLSVLPGGGAGGRPGGGGRKASIVSLASSIGSRFSSFGGGGGSERRPSYVEKEKEREEDRRETALVRGQGGAQSLMAGVHHVIEFDSGKKDGEGQ
jgi:hypothetical protein